MLITGINMVLEEQGRGAQRMGEGGLGVESEGIHPRPYPPMSKGRELIAKGEGVPIPPTENFSSLDQRVLSDYSLLPPVIQSPVNFCPAVGTVEIPYRKNFLKKIDNPLLAHDLAERLVAYFSRPLSGWYDETIRHRDGTEEVIRKPYTAPLPMLTEFANMYGFTESELRRAAKRFPDDLGEALIFARDVMKTALVRGGLSSEYNPQFATFAAKNEVGMKDKSEHLNKTVTVSLNELVRNLELAQSPEDYDE